MSILSNFKGHLAAIATSAILFSGAAANAQFAVTVVHNTTLAPATYAYSWGEVGPWKVATLLPGQSNSHAVPDLGVPIPWFYVQFNSNRGPQLTTRQLGSLLSLNSIQGKVYQFRQFTIADPGLFVNSQGIISPQTRTRLAIDVFPAN